MLFAKSARGRAKLFHCTPSHIYTPGWKAWRAYAVLVGGGLRLGAALRLHRSHEWTSKLTPLGPISRSPHGRHSVVTRPASTPNWRPRSARRLRLHQSPADLTYRPSVAILCTTSHSRPSVAIICITPHTVALHFSRRNFSSHHKLAAPHPRVPLVGVALPTAITRPPNHTSVAIVRVGIALPTAITRSSNHLQ